MGETSSGEYVYCSFDSSRYGDRKELEPLVSYQEEEGLSLLISKQKADERGLKYSCVLKGITLSVNSSLEAVGFTAEISRRLPKHILANVVVHFHDHIFVPTNQAEVALELLTSSKNYMVIGFNKHVYS